MTSFQRLQPSILIYQAIQQSSHTLPAKLTRNSLRCSQHGTTTARWHTTTSRPITTPTTNQSNHSSFTISSPSTLLETLYSSKFTTLERSRVARRLRRNRIALRAGSSPPSTTPYYNRSRIYHIWNIAPRHTTSNPPSPTTRPVRRYTPVQP